MKRILLIIFLLGLLPVSPRAGIFNNSGNTSSDSLAIPFVLFDSTGSQTALANGDSLFLVVFYPNGTKAYEDSGAYNDNNIVSFTRHGLSWYVYKEAVAVLDGSGMDGVYAYTLTVKDLTSSDLTSSFSGQFQLYQAYDFHTEFSRLKEILDTLQDGSNGLDVNLTSFATEIADTLYNRDSTIFSPAYWHKLALASDSGNVATLGGAYAVQLVVYDSANAQVVSGVDVAIRNLAQTALIAIGSSGSGGMVNLNLDADSFLISTVAPGYIFSSFDTLVVTSNTVDTIWGYQFDPGAPAFASLCRLWGYLYDVNGIAQADAEITASLPQGIVRAGSSIISPYSVATTADANGYFYLDLIPSEFMTPDTTKYEISISLQNGTILRQRVMVPDSTNWKLVW